MRVCLYNELSEISRFAGIFEEYAIERGLPMRLVPVVEMCFDEILTNIVSYGYDDGLRHEITVDISVKNNCVVLVIMDDAKAFNPLEVPEPDVESDLESRPVGGLGVFLVRRIAQDVSYSRFEDRNMLTVSIKI